jgi:filamentous hemagglutinin family protein
MLKKFLEPASNSRAGWSSRNDSSAEVILERVTGEGHSNLNFRISVNSQSELFQRFDPTSLSFV